MKKINIPSDMFFLFLIRMDYEMIDTLLEPDEIYMGKEANGFLQYIIQEIEHHRSLGDTSLLSLEGTFEKGSKKGLSLVGNNSKQRFKLVVELNEYKDIVDFNNASDFVFNEFRYGNSPF